MLFRCDKGSSNSDLGLKIFEEQGPLRAFLDQEAHGVRIGYVPTMGSLHEGHLSLVRRARSECDLVVVSVFVNPTQFNDPEDLAAYPRDPEGDQKLLEKEGVDLLFMPLQQEVYPEADPQPPGIDLGFLNERMEGGQRPGHFEGVLMVLDRLFGMLRPHRAYFGEKDFQQLLVVRALVEQRRWGIEVVGVPIVRESNGLALSSRNQRLSPEGRERASNIFRVLEWMRDHLHERTVDELKEEADRRLRRVGMDVEYIEIADERSLEPVSGSSSKRPLRAFVAASIEGVRLIDNLALDH